MWIAAGKGSFAGCRAGKPHPRRSHKSLLELSCLVQVTLVLHVRGRIPVSPLQLLLEEFLLAMDCRSGQMRSFKAETLSRRGQLGS